jgi:hypothetical protein
VSDPKSSESPEAPALINNNTVDAVVAVIVFVVGLIVVVEARRIGASWTDDGPGSGYFPFYIGLIVCISAVGIFYQAVFSKSRDTAGFVNREQLGRVLSVLVPAAVFVLGIVYFGIYVSAAIYICGFMIVLGKYPWAKGVLLGIAVSAFFFLMFEVWFKVPLYKGKFEPLSFLGY